MIKTTAIALLLGAGMACTHAATVYSTDFESGSAGSAWSGITTVSGTGTFPGLGSLHLYNGTQDASTLSLSGLTDHSAITVSFNLVVWDSVDAKVGSYPYGDTFQMALDGVTVIDTLFGNYGTSNGASTGPGSVVVENTSNRGYGAGWVDSLRYVSVTYAHTGTDAVIDFRFPSSQGGADEAFGLDNVSVAISSPVPEPQAYVLMLAGLGVLGGLAQRQRNRQA